jgi:hypothetical protein
VEEVYDVIYLLCRTYTMSGEMPMQQNGAPLQYRLGARAVYLSAALLAIYGCAVGQQKQEQPAGIPITQTLPLSAAPVESPHKSEQAEAQEATPEVPASTGHTVWAQGFEGDLILGLDGELYVAYNEATIKHVQSVMKNRGLYSGPINGVLDSPTMESIYTFQQANTYMLRCGVPTPRTRKLLEQGSHTDAS